LLDGFFHIVTSDLRETWKPVDVLSFAMSAIETSPQLSGRFVATEAVVAVAIELRIGETAGMVNLAIPSLTLKTIRQRLDQQRTSHRSENPATELAIKRKLARDLKMTVECEFSGAMIGLRDLLSFSPGDVLMLGPEFDGEVDILVNGTPKFTGSLGVSPKNRQMVVLK